MILDDVIYAISEKLMQKDPGAQSHGLLGGSAGYGQAFENDVFMVHPFCWCEKEDCGWCSDIGAMPQLVRDITGVKYVDSERLPNFHYKPLDFKVWWYKYIGRGMESNQELDSLELSKMLVACIESLYTLQPVEAKQGAQS